MHEQAQNPSLDAMLEPKKNIPPPPAAMNGTVNLGGMEWLDYEGVKWYRKAYSGAEWNKWQKRTRAMK